MFSACGGAPSPRDLASLRHLELCVREALRLYPSIPVMSRRLGGTTHTNIDGYQVIARLIFLSRSSYIQYRPGAARDERDPADVPPPPRPRPVRRHRAPVQTGAGRGGAQGQLLLRPLLRGAQELHRTEVGGEPCVDAMLPRYTGPGSRCWRPSWCWRPCCTGSTWPPSPRPSSCRPPCWPSSCSGPSKASTSPSAGDTRPRDTVSSASLLIKVIADFHTKPHVAAMLWAKSYLS